MKSPNRGTQLGTAGFIALALLLGSSLIFVGAVYRKVQANRAMLDEFEGFINYGTPIQVTDPSVLGTPANLVITESRVERPVFSTRTNWTRLRFWYEEWAYATREVISDMVRTSRPKDKP
ncbi:hypothetical protein DES53_103116 [Roseimicrobium gellanilyticum]|uniref:Uncharacterized protein n=1 Tax=Roseimicrobium gellanilyticum TaxID=748857 RepID=A0A366HQI8_9BACT|nr:hypothetical protein [Roseimicrobium gellanilyticum]RBP45119.1 hypothetical protein DES53_103116 [Roseimicrobium gellanilyticum]